MSISNFQFTTTTSAALLGALVTLGVGCAEPLTASFVRSGADTDQEKATQPLPGEGQFAFIQRTIFSPSCVSCHSGHNAPHGIDLTSYFHVMNAQRFPPLVVPKEPQKSSLFESVVMGRMPKEKPMLRRDQIETIRSWIAAGAFESDDQPEATPTPVPTPVPGPADPNEPPDETPADPNEPPD